MATHAGRTPLARTSLRSKRAAVAMLAIAAVTLLAVRTAGQSQPRTPGRIVAAGPEVDVSNDPGVQSQVSIAVDPTDDRVLVAGSGNWGRKTRAYSSTDGGSSWTASADPPLPAGVPQTCAFGDSTVGIDRLGRQYYAFIVGLSLRLASAAPSGLPSCSSPTVPTPRHPGRLRHARSPPSSPATRSVTARQTTSPGLPSTSRRRARTPTVPTSSGPAPVAPRASGFCSATRTTARTPGLRPCASTTARSSTGRSRASRSGRTGDVYVVWDDIAARTISIARSTDGGRHFDRMRLVANERSPRSASCDPPGTSIPAHPRRCVTAGATVTVDDSSGRYAGRVYVSYADARQNRGWPVFVAAFDPALRPLGEKLVDPADGATPSDQFQPAAAVDSSTGTLWACFYETNGDPRRIRAVYSCATSSDGGSSWSRPVGAASVASDEAERGANRVGYGDYQGLAVAGGLAHPIWTDSRSARDAEGGDLRQNPHRLRARSPTRGGATPQSAAPEPRQQAPCKSTLSRGRGSSSSPPRAAARRSRCPEQDVAHSRRVPPSSALGSRHTGLVQVAGDLPQRVASCTLPLYPLHDRLRHRRRSPEPDPARPSPRAPPSFAARSACARTARSWRACSPSPCRRGSRCPPDSRDGAPDAPDAVGRAPGHAAYHSVATR